MDTTSADLMNLTAPAADDDSWKAFLNTDTLPAQAAPLHLNYPRKEFSQPYLVGAAGPMGFAPGLMGPALLDFPQALDRGHKRGWSMPAINLSACSSRPPERMFDIQISPMSACDAASISSGRRSTLGVPASVGSTRSSSVYHQPGAVMSTRSSSMAMSLVSSAGRPSSDPTLGLPPEVYSGPLSPTSPTPSLGDDPALHPWRLHQLPSPPQDQDGDPNMLDIDLMRIQSRTSSPISHQMKREPHLGLGIAPAPRTRLQAPPMPPLPNWGASFAPFVPDPALGMAVPLPHFPQMMPDTRRHHTATPKSRRRNRSCGNFVLGRKRARGKGKARPAPDGTDPALVERVRALASKRHLSQVDIMRGSGISNTILSDWLKHKYRGNLVEINSALRYYCDKMEGYFAGAEPMPTFLLKPTRSSRSRMNLGQLIPIEMSFSFGTVRYEDFFLWDPDEIHVTALIFATQTVRDLGLPRNCIPIIEKELESQVAHGMKKLLKIRDMVQKGITESTIEVHIPKFDRKIQWNITDIDTTPEQFASMLVKLWELEKENWEPHKLYIAFHIRKSVLEHFCPPEKRSSLEARRRSARAVFNMLVAAGDVKEPKLEQ